MVGRDNGWTSLTSAEAMIKGFIAGLLVAGGIFCPSLGAAIQVVLVIIGIAAFIDAVMPSNKSMHGFTIFVFTLVGGLVMFGLSLSGSAPVILLVAVIIVVLIYLKNVLTGLHVLSK